MLEFRGCEEVLDYARVWPDMGLGFLVAFGGAFCRYDSKTISSNLATIINFLHKFRKRKVFPVTDENDA